ncbi:hypothetical protein J6590_032184 [Homalodisca vitripennis]|nr:hypothetical protein J6590_032184 [Homalodisca vitripennis]
MIKVGYKYVTSSKKVTANLYEHFHDLSLNLGIISRDVFFARNAGLPIMFQIFQRGLTSEKLENLGRGRPYRLFSKSVPILWAFVLHINEKVYQRDPKASSMGDRNPCDRVRLTKCARPCPIVGNVAKTTINGTRGSTGPKTNKVVYYSADSWQVKRPVAGLEAHHCSPPELDIESHCLKNGDRAWRCLGGKCGATVRTDAHATLVVSSSGKHHGPHPVTMRTLTVSPSKCATVGSRLSSGASTSFGQSNVSPSPPVNDVHYRLRADTGCPDDASCRVTRVATNTMRRASAPDCGVQCDLPSDCRDQRCAEIRDLVASLRITIEVLEAEIQCLKEEGKKSACERELKELWEVHYNKKRLPKTPKKKQCSPKASATVAHHSGKTRKEGRGNSKQ